MLANIEAMEEGIRLAASGGPLRTDDLLEGAQASDGGVSAPPPGWLGKGRAELDRC